MDYTIRKAVPGDAEGIWAALSPVFSAGETYAIPRDISREAALAYWLAPEKTTFVAEADGKIAGTYYLRANQAGPGAHVANGGEIDAKYSDFKDPGTPPKSFSSTGGWVGITDKYWMAAIVPPQNDNFSGQYVGDKTPAGVDAFQAN